MLTQDLYSYPEIYVYIFQTQPASDVVILYSILFATQYACSQSWIDSGLHFSGLVGHSLGQHSPERIQSPLPAGWTEVCR
jgi:hypothetical protein